MSLITLVGRSAAAVFLCSTLVAQDKPAPSIPAIPLRPAPGAADAAKAPKVELLKAGSEAKDFASIDLAGKERRLAEWKGKVLVLDFWATWCGPCRASLPHTQEVAAKYKDQGVVVLAACTSDTRAKFEGWLKENGSRYPDIIFTCDPNERETPTYNERASRKLYGVQGIPTQFIIGRDGRIGTVLVGYEDGEVRLEAALARAGIRVDPAVAAKGEEQIRKDAQ